VKSYRPRWPWQAGEVIAELNGAPVATEALAVLALTNYGSFTSMRVEHGRVRGLALHLERLARDADALFGARLDLDKVRAYVRSAVPATDSPFVVRVTLFDPTLELGRPSAAASPSVLVTTRPAAEGPLPALRLMSAVYERDLPEVKHVGLFGALRCRRIAQQRGFDDALFIGRDSNIIEITTSNIGLIDDCNRIVWPAAACLPGTTMRLIDTHHREDCKTRSVSLSELGDMKAAFATNAAVGVRAIQSVDEIQWPEDSAMLEVVREEYTAIEPDTL
jgi:branched-subunit amino acid aminotransferase/4-amino-4-deoxychorismate lyase